MSCLMEEEKNQMLCKTNHKLIRDWLVVSTATCCGRLIVNISSSMHVITCMPHDALEQLRVDKGCTFHCRQ